MDSKRKVMRNRCPRRWNRRSRSTSTHPTTAPSRAEYSAMNSTNLARRIALPPYSGYNIVDWHIYDRLRSLWKTESRSWSESERRNFVEWVPKAHVTERENTMLDHPLAEYMRCNEPSWGHYVVLRVMFGASQCARQSWWADFKQKYERAVEDAPPGVVPKDIVDVLQANRMDPPPIMNIPTMEVNGVPVESNCGCLWCLKKAEDKASRGEFSSSSEPTPVRRAQRRECPRGQSIYAGEGETGEDRARRSEREQGVEPEEAQDVDNDDDLTMVPTQSSSLQDMSNVVSLEESNRSLREVVAQQGSMIETLVRLMEKQHERMGRLEKRVERGQRRSEGLYRNVNRRIKEVQKALESGEVEEA